LPRLKAEAEDETKFHRHNKDIWSGGFLFMNYNLSKVNLRERERERISGLREIIFKTIKQLGVFFTLGFFIWFNKGRPKTEGLYQFENN